MTESTEDWNWLETIFDDIKLDYQADMLIQDFNELADGHKEEIQSQFERMVKEREQNIIERILEEKPLTTANLGVNLWADRIAALSEEES